MSKKRILIFSTAYFPLVGGAEVAVREITERLRDYEFIMLTAKLRPDLLDVEKVGNIEVHRLGIGNHWDKYRLIWRGARYASNLGHFDAVWAIMASYAGFAASRFKKQNIKTPFLLTLQEGDSRWQIYKHVWWCWPYFKQIFKRADKIQAISNYLAEWARGLGAKCGVEVVANGVDTDKFSIFNFQFSNNFQFEIIKKLNISDRSRFVITISRLVKKNGVEDLIKAMKFLNNDTHLLIAGGGVLKDELVLLVNRLRLVDSVHFLGYLNHEELLPHLKASHVFCRPSLSEGLGNAFLEAMAMGVPIIGTKVGGIPDFLEDPSAFRQAQGLGQFPTGWFCEIRNPKSIAEKIKYILDEKNKGEVSRVVENAKKMVEEKYNWDLIASKMRKIFDSL